MTTYTFPSVTPTSSQIEFVSNTDSFRSPISGAIQTVDRGGERWVIDLSYRNIKAADFAVMTAFITKLNGRQHRFKLHNHAENPRGAFGGTPKVVGANQTGTTLDIDGCSNNITNWIREGDWFSVNDELKQSISDENSDGSGLLTLSFGPRLRVAPADDAAITTSTATGIFILVSSGSWSNKPGDFHDLTIQAEEDIAA